jgi:hypothetical protein
MNPTMKVDSLAAAQAADSAGEFVAFYQHAQGVAAVDRPKSDTPRVDVCFDKSYHLAELFEEAKKLERELAAANETIKRFQPPINITTLTGELFAVKEQLAAANKDLAILSIEKGRAREDAAHWQLEAEAAYKQGDEAIRRLRQMHRSHSDSVQWYQNAVAQALKSLNALPDKLEF